MRTKKIALPNCVRTGDFTCLDLFDSSPGTLVGTEVALINFNIGIREELGEGDAEAEEEWTSTVGVLQVRAVYRFACILEAYWTRLLVVSCVLLYRFLFLTHAFYPRAVATIIGPSQGHVTKLSRRRDFVLYQSSSFSGDSGSAVILANGQVIGVHREGVNAAKERLRRFHDTNERLSAIESSLDSLIASTSNGCIAVFTGCDSFKKCFEEAKTKTSSIASSTRGRRR